jgi:hypothetical protein
MTALLPFLLMGISIFCVTLVAGLMLFSPQSAPGGTEARTLQRFSEQGHVILYWNTAQSRAGMAKCKLTDMSEHGAAVSSRVKLEVGTHITIELPEKRLTTTADVRRCTGSRGRYTLGLEFCGPLYSMFHG